MKNHWLNQRTIRLELKQLKIGRIDESRLQRIAQAEKIHNSNPDRAKVIRSNIEVMPAREEEKFSDTLAWLCDYYNRTQDLVCSNVLAKKFYKLAEKVVEHHLTSDICRQAYPILDRDDAIQECVMIAFEKVHRFRPEKGKAENFFTTIMMSILRIAYRTNKNYEELKRRYQKYLSGKAVDKRSASS